MIVRFCQAERGLAVVGRRGEVRAAVEEERAHRRVAVSSRVMERGLAAPALVERFDIEPFPDFSAK